MSVNINASTTNGLVLTSDTSGELKLQANGADIATVSSTGIAMAAGKTLPAASLTGTLPAGTNVISAGTSVASTSGTSIDFTSIPSWVKRIVVMFNGVSTAGSGTNLEIRIGSGSVQTSGYLASCAANTNNATTYVAAYTSGYAFTGQSGVNDIHNGHLILTLVDSSTYKWVGTGLDNLSNNTRMLITAGSVTLGGVLDRVRVTTTNGTDTFDAGSINILYE